MSADLDELERITMEAVKYHGYWQHAFSNHGTSRRERRSDDDWAYDVALFHESARPTVVLDLIARIRELKRVLRDAKFRIGREDQDTTLLKEIDYLLKEKW